MDGTINLCICSLGAESLCLTEVGKQIQERKYISCVKMICPFSLGLPDFRLQLHKTDTGPARDNFVILTLLIDGIHVQQYRLSVFTLLINDYDQYLLQGDNLNMLATTTVEIILKTWFLKFLSNNARIIK